MFDLWCSKWILYKCFSDKRYLVIFCCAIWCARVLHCITLRRHANPVCLNSYFYQTPKIVMADEHELITFSFVRKSGTVYDGALVPGRAFGPCQYVAESARPGQPGNKKESGWLCIYPTFYVLKIPCALNLIFWTSSRYMPFDFSTLIWCGCRSAFHNCDPCIAQAKPHVIGLRRESDSWLHFWQTLVRNSW